MNKIHPQAIVSSDIQIGQDNTIAANAIIEEGVKIGSGNHIRAGAYLCKGTTLGDNNDIHMHAIIGHIPQDLAFEDKETFTVIGNNNQIREFVTIHRGTKPGSTTIIGNNNYVMANAHIAHNCELGNNIIMVNQASLTGYCIVEDNAFLSGITGFHQFTRLGKLSLVSALSAVNKDVPPYVICGGRPAMAQGINVVGLRRAGFNAKTRESIKQAFKLLYRSNLNVSQALEKIKATLKGPEIDHFVSFVEASKRGIVDGFNQELDTLKTKKI